MLHKYLTHHESAKTSMVISMKEVGAVGLKLRQQGIDVISLDLNGPKDIFASILKYRNILNTYNPRYIIGWMYHANLFIGIYSLFHRKKKITWNIRCGLTDYNKWKIQRKFIVKLCRWLSKYVHAIIYNSHKSMRQHVQFGFTDSKSTVVYNGFSINDVTSSAAKIHRIDVSVPEESFLIGSFGRNIPLKRMSDLLSICQRLRQMGCPAHILYIGRGFCDEQFIKLAEDLSVAEVTHVLREVNTIAPYYRILDMFCLCSEAEGFPNVIGEAAYSGIPIVCSDISDLKRYFLREWQICPVGDIDKFTVTAYRIYQLTRQQRRELIRGQLSAFMKKTQILNVVKEMADIFH